VINEIFIIVNFWYSKPKKAVHQDGLFTKGSNFRNKILGGLIVPTLMPTKRNIALLEKQVDILIKVVLGLTNQKVDEEYVDALKKLDRHSSLTGRNMSEILDTVVEGKSYIRKVVNLLRKQEDKYTVKKQPARIRWKRYLSDNKNVLKTHQLNGLLSFLLGTTPESTGKELRQLAESAAQELDKA